MPAAQRIIRVQIVQPVVPHYRRPLFDALAQLPDLDLHIDASATAPGSPPSIACAQATVDLAHPCLEPLPGQLFWQRGLRLREGLGRGDVLVVGGNPRFLSNLPLIEAARHRGIAVAWWGQGWGATSARWRTALRVWLMRRADVLMLYTDREVDAFAARGFERERLFGLNNALDQGPIEAARASWPAERLLRFRREQGLADRPLLLFCGRLRTDPRTDLDVALRALAEIRVRHPDCLLAIIGTGPDEPRLRALASTLGVDAQLRWLGAIYEEAELAPWFLTASALVYPGSIGLSLLHAFGYGLPVITHDRLRHHGPEIAALIPGVNGLLHARADAQGLAACADVLLAGRALRALMSAAALHTVSETYGMPGMVRRFHAAIQAAAALSGARASERDHGVVGDAHRSLR